MTEQKQNSTETLAYRVAAGMFDSALRACARLPEADQQTLLREIGKRILEKISQLPTKTIKSIQVLGIEINQENSEDSGSGHH
jgi:DNA polymerase/3'-5' exonuclease PolX